jgi:hypothetical protein
VADPVRSRMKTSGCPDKLCRACTTRHNRLISSDLAELLVRRRRAIPGRGEKRGMTMSKPDIDKMTRTEVIENLAKAICVMRNAGSSRERIIRVVESAIEELECPMPLEQAMTQ